MNVLPTKIVPDLRTGMDALAGASSMRVITLLGLPKQGSLRTGRGRFFGRYPGGQLVRFARHESNLARTRPQDASGLPTVRYKVWRSNKDKSLHLLCGEGAEAFNTECPQCKGTGCVPMHHGLRDKECPRCGGRGWVKSVGR